MDVGGPLYDDRPYYRSILHALREMGASMSDEAYAREYERCRQAQDGSFRRRLAHAFLGLRLDKQCLDKQCLDKQCVVAFVFTNPAPIHVSLLRR